jgi:hypothetical protein
MTKVFLQARITSEIVQVAQAAPQAREAESWT